MLKFKVTGLYGNEKHQSQSLPCTGLNQIPLQITTVGTNIKIILMMMMITTTTWVSKYLKLFFFEKITKAKTAEKSFESESYLLKIFTLGNS